MQEPVRINPLPQLAVHGAHCASCLSAHVSGTRYSPTAHCARHKTHVAVVWPPVRTEFVCQLFKNCCKQIFPFVRVWTNLRIPQWHTALPLRIEHMEDIPCFVYRSHRTVPAQTIRRTNSSLCYTFDTQSRLTIPCHHNTHWRIHRLHRACTWHMKHLVLWFRHRQCLFYTA